MSRIISASRRTDIPAFYSDWFVNRLKSGYLYVRHPYSGRWIYVSLKPEDVGAIVFWSKNLSPLLKKLEIIERITRNLFFHFTITGNKELEPNTPDYRDAIEDFIYIVNRYSSEQIVWRFDPICITNRLDFGVYEELFRMCAERLSGYARRCYISFVNPYRKVLRNFQRYTDHRLVEISTSEKRLYATRLTDIAKGYGIKIYACCNDYLLSDRVFKGSCINGEYLSTLFSISLDTLRTPSRKECACTKSIDIGAYDTCAHGCVYCYANTDKERAENAAKRHNPRWNSLEAEVEEDARDCGSLFPAVGKRDNLIPL
jgi:DNA repair photolyase